MASQHLANQDFERAVSKSFWRKIMTWLKGESNELLPFDEVRDKLKIQGQYYSGLKEVPIDLIVGSVGRYNDFDRIFLPRQRRTKDRWVNIDKAHYEEIPLPPVELYQIGEIYFVKDGNHRVSVARERGQEFVDAHVTVIDIPVWLSSDTEIDDLDLKQEHAEFILRTNLRKIRPEARIEATVPGVYPRLLEHIDVHRWYMGEKAGSEVPYEQAVASWFDQVYQPVINFIHEHDLLRSFTNFNEADLYLWILEYVGYLQQASRTEEIEGRQSKGDAAKQLQEAYRIPAVKKMIQLVNKDNRINKLILQQERSNFLERTRILEYRPEAQIQLTIPGQYDRLLEHIAVHRWYLGEQKGEEITYPDAIRSWYDHVYMPIVGIIRDQNIMQLFPGRTETDLYLWVIDRQQAYQDEYGDGVPVEQAIEDLSEDARKK